MSPPSASRILKYDPNCRAKNDDYYHKGKEGGGQGVMIEIIISENDNDGRPLTEVDK